jgi:hypothetical protein
MNPELLYYLDQLVTAISRIDSPVKVDEHRGWLCVIIRRGMIQVDLDMPSLVSRWNRYVFDGNTVMYLFFAETKALDKCYNGTKACDQQ